VQRIFLDATSICAKETRISNAMECFGSRMEGLHLKAGKFIVEEQFKLILDSLI
jgi:hypothetical protein